MLQLASNNLYMHIMTDAMNKKINNLRDNNNNDDYQRWKQPLQPQPQKSKTSDYWDDNNNVDPWDEWDRISDGYKKRKQVDTMPPSSSPSRKSNNSPPEERLWRDRNKRR